MNTYEFLIIEECLDAESRAAFLDAPKPDAVGGRPVPATLDEIKVGQFIELVEMKEAYDILTVPCRELLHMSDKEVMDADAMEVWGFSRWCVSEVARIGALFEQCRVEPTPEEMRAGVDALHYGWFGLIDYYAQRMGIIDHDYVLKRVGVMRLWQCLKMDADRRKYERRLQEAARAKVKSKK